MKRLAFFILLNLFVLNWINCEEVDSNSDSEVVDECDPGDERCSGDIIQRCENGLWVDWYDCADENGTCEPVGGVFQCVSGPDNGDDDDDDHPPEWTMFEDFESYNVGDYIVATAGYPWITWSDPPLTGEDAQISDAIANTGKNSLQIAEKNNVVFLLELTAGLIWVEFELFVEKGKLAYYSFLNEYGGDDESLWGFEMFFYDNGIGNLVIAKKQYPFKFKEGVWLTVKHLIDIDNDIARINVDGTEVHSWPWSTAQGKYPANLDGIEFYSVPGEPDSGYFIDNFRFDL